MICDNVNFGKVIEFLNIGEVGKLPEWESAYIFKKLNDLWVRKEDGSEHKHRNPDWLNSIIWRDDWQVLSRTSVRRCDNE